MGTQKERTKIMSKILLVGAHGAGCSMIKSQLTGVQVIDPVKNTCHESWKAGLTQHNDNIFFTHNLNLEEERKKYPFDTTIWLRIDPENIQQLVQRVVVLDFMYTDDEQWLKKDHCWTPEKHQRIAGPDWPEYSQSIDDYPTWCLDELCQVAYDRSSPWFTTPATGFDYVIGTSDLYSFVDPVGLASVMSELGCQINYEFLFEWRKKNLLMWQKYEHLFTWTPDHNPLQQ
jgi:hypothetical protein